MNYISRKELLPLNLLENLSYLQCNEELFDLGIVKNKKLILECMCVLSELYHLNSNDTYIYKTVIAIAQKTSSFQDSLYMYIDSHC